jgi:hypothetical protein
LFLSRSASADKPGLRGSDKNSTRRVDAVLDSFIIPEPKHLTPAEAYVPDPDDYSQLALSTLRRRGEPNRQGLAFFVGSVERRNDR